MSDINITIENKNKKQKLNINEVNDMDKLSLSLI